MGLVWNNRGKEKQMNGRLPKPIEHYKKLCACLPFADSSAGLVETQGGMRELILYAERDGSEMLMMITRLTYQLESAVKMLQAASDYFEKEGLNFAPYAMCAADSRAEVSKAKAP